VSEAVKSQSDYPPDEDLGKDVLKTTREAKASVFDKMHRILSRRMPTLELIHERFARTMRLQLFNMIRCRCEVDLHPPRIKPYGEFLGSFPERTNINIVNIKSLRGVACWIVDPAVIYLTIDNMFGGEGHLEPKIVPKEYTATELRIVRRFVDMVLAEYEKAWRQVYELKFDFVRSEGNFQFAKITGNDEMVLHCKFTIDINGRAGDVDFCVPFWVFEPLKATLFAQSVGFQMETDTKWTGALESEMQTAEVEMAAILAEKKMVLGDILSLNVGEIIPIEVQDPITAYVNRVPMIRGKYGVKNGRYALRVEEIRNPTDFVSLGLKNKQLLGPQKYDDEFKFGMEK